MRRYALTIVPLLMLAACASVPMAINDGIVSGETPASVLERESTGKSVRWGGVIISVSPSQTETCFEILSRPLDNEGEPRPIDATEGRFVACCSQFYDPAAYPGGRHLTVKGVVQTPVMCKIGDYERRCPRVKIEALYLWPKRVYQREPCFYDPFWGTRNIWPWYYR